MNLALPAATVSTSLTASPPRSRCCGRQARARFPPCSAEQAVTRGADPTEVAYACVAQWTKIADAVDELPDDRFEAPTDLPGWRFSELVAHLAMCAGAPARWLAEPAPVKAEANVAAYLLC